MKATNEALDAGISKSLPGNTANDVAQAFWKILDKYNIKKVKDWLFNWNWLSSRLGRTYFKYL